jgi:hypothetical protein
MQRKHEQHYNRIYPKEFQKLLAVIIHLFQILIARDENSILVLRIIVKR